MTDACSSALQHSCSASLNRHSKGAKPECVHGSRPDNKRRSTRLQCKQREHHDVVPDSMVAESHCETFADSWWTPCKQHVRKQVSVLREFPGLSCSGQILPENVLLRSCHPMAQHRLATPAQQQTSRPCRDHSEFSVLLRCLHWCLSKH